MMARPFSATAIVSTQAIPCHSGFVAAACRISLLATVMASRMRSSAVPVWRSSRARTRLMAISAAFSPAACPPMPSITRKMPRSGSRCTRSSLFCRTMPTWLSPAHRSLVLTGISAAAAIGCGLGIRLEVKKDDVRQADARRRGQLHFYVLVALLAIHVFDAGGNLLAVDAGSQAAQIFDEELAGLGVAPQEHVFARNIRERGQLQVGPVVPAAAPDHDLILGHAVSLAAGLVFIFDGGVRLHFLSFSQGFAPLPEVGAGIKAMMAVAFGSMGTVLFGKYALVAGLTGQLG